MNEIEIHEKIIEFDNRSKLNGKRLVVVYAKDLATLIAGGGN